MADAIANEFPLRIASAADFAEVRSTLQAARFDATTICRTLQIKDMSDIAEVELSTVDFTGLPEQLPLLLNLFLGQGPIPSVQVEQVLGQRTLNAFRALGLLATGEGTRSGWYAKVLLYPVAGLWIASDRHTSVDNAPFVAPPDIVFPAIYGGTLRFLELLPQSRAEAALDLGAGSGIGAFVLSRTCTNAVASDITERAAHFARFNRALNDLDNVDVVCGDLYGAVRGQTFDRIVSHPPYVPSLNVAAIWRDGGATGELLVRRIIEHLPDYLRPGGLACVLSLGLDTSEGNFEDRVRGWLGERGREFDIIFAVAEVRTPEEVLRKLAAQNPDADQGGSIALKEALAEAAVVAMPYGALVVRRHRATESRTAWTLRAELGSTSDGRDLEQAFSLRDRLSEPDIAQCLARSRPTLSPNLQVKTTHVVANGSLRPNQYIFEAEKPFVVRGQVDGWMVPLFARLDGKRTPLEIYDKAKADGELPDGFGLTEFSGMVVRMIERGFLLLPEDGDSNV